MYTYNVVSDLRSLSNSTFPVNLVYTSKIKNNGGSEDGQNHSA